MKIPWFSSFNSVLYNEFCLIITRHVFRLKKVLTWVSILVSMCENLGIRANTSRPRMCASCEHKWFIIIKLRLNLGIRGLKLASRPNLELGPRLADICTIVLDLFPSTMLCLCHTLSKITQLNFIFTFAEYWTFKFSLKNKIRILYKIYFFAF